MAVSMIKKASASVAGRTSVPSRVCAGARRVSKSRAVVFKAAAPAREFSNAIAPSKDVNRVGLPQLITKESVVSLEAELDQGASMAALRRFNDNLQKIPADKWEAVLRPVFNELCFNLESFNAAFTGCLLQVQSTIGESDYVRRDMALKNLIQPLAGEYGMHNNMPQLDTHRELFAKFFQSLFCYPLGDLIADSPAPEAAEKMFVAMMRDIKNGGNIVDGAMEQASYALGYNLAIEYLADYEKTWMLDSFRALDSRIFSGLGKKIDWVFLEVHAEGEAEHAAIGHNAVLNFVPEEHTPIMRRAMQDHDRDMAAFYNRLADMLEC